MTDYLTRRREEARLIVLEALHRQPDERLSSAILTEELRRFGIDEAREWLHAEIDWLERMGAVTVLRPAGAPLVIAVLAEEGARHLRRAVAIPGIRRPLRPEV